MPIDNNVYAADVVLDMIAHGRAAMRKAAELRQAQISENTKIAQAVPEAVDALIAGGFVSPDDRDLAITRMQKPAFAIGMLKEFAKSAQARSKSNYSIGSADSKYKTSYNDNNPHAASDAAWESMLYNY